MAGRAAAVHVAGGRAPVATGRCDGSVHCLAYPIRGEVHSAEESYLARLLGENARTAYHVTAYHGTAHHGTPSDRTQPRDAHLTEAGAVVCAQPGEVPLGQPSWAPVLRAIPQPPQGRAELGGMGWEGTWLDTTVSPSRAKVNVMYDSLFWSIYPYPPGLRHSLR